MSNGNSIDLQKFQREEMRWRVLRVLEASRGIPCVEEIILRTVSDVKMTVSLEDVRRELLYLEDKGLVSIEDKTAENWYASLTAQGVDVVEYTVPAPAGVGRPARR